MPTMPRETATGSLVAVPDARVRRGSSDLVAGGRYRVPARPECHDALPVRVAGILIAREQVDRMASVGDLPGPVGTRGAPDERGIRPGTDRWLAGRHERRPRAGAGAGALALGSCVCRE